jgi:hypothetical protein
MTAMRGQQVDGASSAWVEGREAQPRRSYVVFVALMGIVGVLALLTDVLMYAPLVVALPYGAYVGFAWLRWWCWQNRTGDQGQVLVPASVPRSAVARDPAIVFPQASVRGVLVVGDGVWEWRPPRLTRHEFHCLRWRHSEIVGLVPEPLWGPGLPPSVCLRLHLTDGRPLVVEAQLDRRLFARTPSDFL